METSRAHTNYIGLFMLEWSSACLFHYKAGQRGGRRVTGPGLVLFRPLQMTHTLDKTYKCDRRISYIHPKSSFSKKSSSNENTEKNLLPCFASAEGNMASVGPDTMALRDES